MSDVKRYYDSMGLVCLYYTYNGAVYVGAFPEEWAKTNKANTGPNECGNCAFYGSIGEFGNKKFIGYCANCAKDYDGERGRGLIGFGEENNIMSCYASIYDTYMKCVDLKRIETTELSSEINGPEFDMWHCQSNV